MIKKLSSMLLATLSLHAASDQPLRHLIDYDKTSCLEKLHQSNETELWENFLEGQIDLYFKTEFSLITSGNWWQNAQTILEFGSGKGAYLNQLFQHANSKKFLGVDNQVSCLETANQLYKNEQLTFKEGDAEILDTSLQQTADLILYRLKLEETQNPVLALENAYHYLLPTGHIVIIEACDKAKKTSHAIHTLSQALKRFEKYDNSQGILNRTVSLDILKTVESENSPLNSLYEVVYTNVDQSGNILDELPCFQGKNEREKFFNHILLFLTICNRVYQIPVNLETAYDELKGYVEDENAWTTPGMHILILKKKGIVVS